MDLFSSYQIKKEIVDEEEDLKCRAGLDMFTSVQIKEEIIQDDENTQSSDTAVKDFTFVDVSKLTKPDNVQSNTELDVFSKVIVKEERMPIKLESCHTLCYASPAWITTEKDCVDDDNKRQHIYRTQLREESKPYSELQLNQHTSQIIIYDGSLKSYVDLPYNELEPNSEHIINNETLYTNTAVSHNLKNDEHLPPVQLLDLNLQQKDQNISVPKSCKVAMVTSSVFNKGKRVWDKKFMCCFCKVMVSKIARHFELKHQDESLVAKFISLEKNSKERLFIITQLRCRGKFIQNNEALRNGGTIVPKKIPKKNCYKPNDYLPFEFCGDLYSKKDLKNHLSRCILSNNSRSISMFDGRGIKARAGLLLPIFPNLGNSFKSNILQQMKHDEVYDTIEKDNLIIEFGNSLFSKLGHLKKHYRLIKDRLREIGRLMVEIKKIDKTIISLENLLHPKKYCVLLAGVKSLVGFNESHEIKAPSLAIRIGQTITKCGTVLKSSCYMDDTLQHKLPDVDKFLYLMKSKWNEDIRNKARTALRENQWNNEVKQPTAENRKNISAAELSNTKNISTTKKIKHFIRRQWSDEEQQSVRRHFKVSIMQTFIVPGKNEIEEFMRENKSSLNNRKWKDIKNFIWNAIKSRR